MELTVLTYNIRYDVAHDGPHRWIHRRPHLIDQIATLQPDIIGFQEVLPHQREELERGLVGYRFEGRGRESDGGGEQCLLAFRPRLRLVHCETFWLSEQPQRPGSVGWDAMLPRICTQATWRLGQVEWSVLNAHFDHHGVEARLEAARLLRQRCRTLDHAHLVIGDFNSLPDSAAVTALRQTLQDSFAWRHPEDPRGTYHEFGRLEPATRIDYLLASPHWEICDCQIVEHAGPLYPSDHFPVWGRFRWKEEKDR